MGKLRWFWEEWGWPILFAMPFFAAYVWLDHNPSFAGVLLFNVVLGGLGGAVTVGSAGLMADLEREGPPRMLWWVAGGFVLGAWCNTTLPYLFEVPYGEGWWPLDLYARTTWTLAGAWVAGFAWFRARFRVGWVLAWALQPALWAALWGRGSTRGYGALGLLVGVLVAAAIGTWIQRGLRAGTYQDTR